MKLIMMLMMFSVSAFPCGKCAGLDEVATARFKEVERRVIANGEKALGKREQRCVNLFNQVKTIPEAWNGWKHYSEKTCKEFLAI